MTMDSTKSAIGSSEGGHFLFGDWFDPLENGVRTRIRVFIEELLEAELDAAPGRDRYERLRRGGGRYLPSIVVVASGEPGAPVICIFCCAATGATPVHRMLADASKFIAEKGSGRVRIAA